MHTEFVSKTNPMFGLCLQAKSLTGLMNQFVTDVEADQLPPEVIAAAHAAYQAVKSVDLLLADHAAAKAHALHHYSHMAEKAARAPSPFIEGLRALSADMGEAMASIPRPAAIDAFHSPLPPKSPAPVARLVRIDEGPKA
ncbi:hypothetical protein L2Y94_05570 [Luteibacter aegosomatis]|uniref:hypothetical protein n=1 Tax=Luteibacter aegosomatis TaxID=2911537 RepID=UPI001FF7F866|nr:hypothetical protein [Luteibacter aegosomatis]UPG86823.1 hypothetical protein L2Y94_05570 [Luteibacter aegosomatis]